MFTKNNNLDKPPAIFITTCTDLKNEYEIALVEAALISSNKMELYLNEQNTKLYSREYVTININGNTYGLNSENIVVKNT